MRLTDPAYLKMIRWLPCICCGRFPREDNLNEAAHVRYADASFNKPITGNSIRPDDCWVLPMCRKCHTEGPKAQHRSGERAFWAEQPIEPLSKCVALYKCYQDGQKSRLSWPQLRDDMILIIGSGWIHG